MTGSFPRHLARIRMPLLIAGLALAFGAPAHGSDPLGGIGVIMVLGALVLSFTPLGRIRREPVEVRPPVAGRWMAINSPADRVPSHGTHEFGQTYAVDLVHRPDDGAAWTAVEGFWPPARRPESFPSFGRPILAPADAVVVRAVDGQRDHRSRNSWPGVVYLFLVEGLVRGLAAALSPRFVLGNHVVLDLGDGVYAVLAHLRRGSVRVRPGQRVTAGEPIAECGNSGNSSEPHLHFQLMDSPRAATALGLPFAFAFRADGAEQCGVPRNRQVFTAAGLKERR
ncbi:M23 family metallopeptidase [Thermomonospora catenispora]|uniref:M23 family metallopeptidase n=1 Tax=Thermomonospora catenispora TaxID=2493090 RepID=UPI001123BCDA|nr:M23 family metallopeptidase [Thermomonospora catenispora]TNY37354.1 M23 family metallopeptidase [Thermomonospora catenispora]